MYLNFRIIEQFYVLLCMHGCICHFPLYDVPSFRFQLFNLVYWYNLLLFARPTCRMSNGWWKELYFNFEVDKTNTCTILLTPYLFLLFALSFVQISVEAHLILSHLVMYVVKCWFLLFQRWAIYLSKCMPRHKNGSGSDNNLSKWIDQVEDQKNSRKFSCDITCSR